MGDVPLPIPTMDWHNAGHPPGFAHGQPAKCPFCTPEERTRRSAASQGLAADVDRVSVPSLMVCPRCEGQRYDRGSCALCGNIGYLHERDASRLAHVQAIQILATFALALDMELSPASPDQIKGRQCR